MVSEQVRHKQAQKTVKDRKFWILKKEKLHIHEAKTKALISFAVTAKLICAFVFAYAKCWFHIMRLKYYVFVLLFNIPVNNFSVMTVKAISFTAEALCSKL